MGAIAQFLPWRPASATRSCTDSTPPGSFTSVPDGNRAPRGNTLLTARVTLVTKGTPLGQIKLSTLAELLNRLPASRTLPMARVWLWVSNVPAANSTLPEASRTAAASTVPAGSTNGWVRVAATGKRVPDGSNRGLLSTSKLSVAPAGNKVPASRVTPLPGTTTVPPV